MPGRPERIASALAGYAPIIGEVAERLREDPYLLAAIMLRESGAGYAPGYTPQGSPDGTGDHGHGRGLFQIDDRGPYKRLIEPAPWPVRSQVGGACLVLSDARRELRRFRGRPNYRAAWVSAYNAGAPRVSALMAVEADPNLATTGRDYARWVLARAIELRVTQPGLFPPQGVA